MNRGEYNKPVEIWEKYKTEETDDLGEAVIKERKVKSVFAKIETRIGSLLSGNRPADTVVEKTTHKISYPFYNFPELLPKWNYLKIGNTKFEIDYTLDEGFRHIELQVFVHEMK